MLINRLVLLMAVVNCVRTKVTKTMLLKYLMQDFVLKMILLGM